MTSLFTVIYTFLHHVKHWFLPLWAWLVYVSIRARTIEYYRYVKWGMLLSIRLELNIWCTKFDRLRISAKCGAPGQVWSSRCMTCTLATPVQKLVPALHGCGSNAEDNFNLDSVCFISNESVRSHVIALTLIRLGLLTRQVLTLAASLRWYRVDSFSKHALKNRKIKYLQKTNLKWWFASLLR